MVKEVQRLLNQDRKNRRQGKIDRLSAVEDILDYWLIASSAGHSLSNIETTSPLPVRHIPKSHALK